MQTTKFWWQSKTLWASLVAILAGLAQTANINLDATLQSELVELLTATANIVAGAIGLYGRLTADAKLIWRPKT